MMKKILLASTCAAAISLFGALTLSDESFGQQNTNGVSQQENEHKAAPSPESVRPGAASENRERAPRTGAADQRENARPGKADGGLSHAPRTAEQSSQTENGPMRGDQANPKAKRTQRDDINRNGGARLGATAQSQGAQAPVTGERTQRRPAEGRAAAEPRTGAGQEAPGGPGASNRDETDGQPDIRLNANQASDFRSRLERRGRTARASVDFEARVGVTVPETVRLEPIPVDILVEYPQFRGYEVVMADDEILVVDPRSREIVEVVGGGTNAAEARPHRVRLHLTREQDELIRRNIRIEHPAQVEFDEQLDERAPDSVTLVPLPASVIADIPDMLSDDYFIDQRDHVVIVDPETHEVVGIVEE